MKCEVFQEKVTTGAKEREGAKVIEVRLLSMGGPNRVGGSYFDHRSRIPRHGDRREAR